MDSSDSAQRWWSAGRALWTVAFVSVIILFAVGVPATYTNLQVMCPSINCDNWQLAAGGIRSLHGIGLTLDDYAATLVAINLLSAVLWLVLAVLLFWRGGTDRMALAAAFFLVLMTGGTFGGIIATLAEAEPAWRLPVDVMEFFGQLSIVAFFLVFPDGRLVPRWSGWLLLPAAVMALSPVYATLLPALSPYSTLLNTLLAALYLSVVTIQIYRYRYVSTNEQRRQTRWVLLGGAMTAFGLAAIIALQIVGRATLSVSVQESALLNMTIYTAWYIIMVPIPISIALAVTRSHLWDIDVVINRTLVYGSLTITLATLYIGGVIALQSLFRVVTGQSSELAVAIATLAVAALFNPWRRRLQSFIDRRFYRQKYDSARILAAFNTRLRDEVDLDQLSSDLAGVLHETVQPTTISLWLPTSGGQT